MELFSPINRAGGSGSSSITVPGSDTQVIFNDGGVLGADTDLTWNKADKTLSVTITGGVISVGSATNVAANASTGPALHLQGESGGFDSPTILLTPGSDYPYDRGIIRWDQRDKRLILEGSRYNCNTDYAGVEMRLWNDNLNGVLLDGVDSLHVNFGFFNIDASSGGTVFGTGAHNTVQIKNIGVIPWVPAVDQAGFTCLDYAGGDARLYFFSEASSASVIIGNGEVVTTAVEIGSRFNRYPSNANRPTVLLSTVTGANASSSLRFFNNETSGNNCFYEMYMYDTVMTHMIQNTGATACGIRWEINGDTPEALYLSGDASFHSRFSFFSATDVSPAGSHKVIGIANGAIAPGSGTTDGVSLWCSDYAAGDARLYVMGEANVNTLIFGNGKVHIDEVPDVDLSTTGISSTGTAGEALAFGDVCYLAADSWYYKADADQITTMPGIVMATGTIGASASGEFLEFGYARKDAWNWTPQGFIYVDTVTSGGMTQTAPSGTGDQVQIVGYAYGTDVVKFMPQLVIIEM